MKEGGRRSTRKGNVDNSKAVSKRKANLVHIRSQAPRRASRGEGKLNRSRAISLSLCDLHRSLSRENIVKGIPPVVTIPRHADSGIETEKGGKTVSVGSSSRWMRMRVVQQGMMGRRGRLMRRRGRGERRKKC